MAMALMGDRGGTAVVVVVVVVVGRGAWGVGHGAWGVGSSYVRWPCLMCLIKGEQHISI